MRNLVLIFQNLERLSLGYIGNFFNEFLNLNISYLFFLGLLSRVSSSNRLPGSSWQSQESLQSSSSKLLQQQFGSVRIADQVL